MKRATNLPRVKESKLAQIRSGNVQKLQTGGMQKKVIQGKEGKKFSVTQTKNKFEESGVTKQRKNFVQYTSKTRTEVNENLQILTPQLKPRKDEKIYQTKKKVEYKDNYQYHESKDIKDKDPKKVSVVTHRRKGDIVGGTYETSTFQKKSTYDSGKGPKLYSSQTTTTTTRKNASAKPVKTVQRSTTASKTLPAQSKQMRKEVKKYSSNTNLKPAPKKPAATKTTTTRTTTTTTKTTTKKAAPARAQSAGGRRH
jgi:hypothetical protein